MEPHLQTMDDVKIKTGFGGLREQLSVEAQTRHSHTRAHSDDYGAYHSLVTLVSLSLILSLTLYEFVDYRRVHWVSRSGASEHEPPKLTRSMSTRLTGTLDRRRQVQGREASRQPRHRLSSSAVLP